MAESGKINAVDLANIAKLDAVDAANIAKVNGLTFTQAAAFLLDTYTGATAGYSVRRLATSATNLMRIREDAGDTETDIGYDSNNELDTAAIASHCGTANGYVVTWYDQSGNSVNATQGTEASQPQIYNGSAVITENGKPLLVVGFLNISFSNNGNTSIFSVAKGPTTGQRTVSISRGSNFPYWGYAQESTSTANSDSGVTSYVNGSSLPASTTRQQLFDAMNETQSSLTMVGSMTNTPTLALGWNSAFLMHDSQEFILWQSDESSNRTGIESNVNTYFSIY